MKRFLNWKWSLAAILILIVAAILILPRLFASPGKMTIKLTGELTLPELTGPFPVGRSTVYMVDKNRSALPGSEEPREFVVTIFYPAVPSADAYLALMRRNR